MKPKRTLAVIAAVLFVGAVALATAGPDTMSLGAALRLFGPAADKAFQGWTVRFLGLWSWSHLMQPLLVRPAWLPFGSLCLICTGLAVSWPARDAPRGSHRRS